MNIYGLIQWIENFQISRQNCYGHYLTNLLYYYLQTSYNYLVIAVLLVMVKSKMFSLDKGVDPSPIPIINFLEKNIGMSFQKLP